MFDQRAERNTTPTGVSTEGKKRAILLSVVGAKHYAILKGLTENKPEEKTFEDLCTLMERHIRPAPNVIHERFLFNTSDKKEDESISEYVTLLRKMSEHCNFEEKVNEHIRDRLVVGVKEEKLQERLLGERTLTLEKVIEIAVSMESARKYSRLMLGTSTSETKTPIQATRQKRVLLLLKHYPSSGQDIRGGNADKRRRGLLLVHQHIIK